MHGCRSTGSEYPLVYASAGVFEGNRRCAGTPWLLGTLEKFNVQHFEGTRAEIVNAVNQRNGTHGGRGQFAWFSGSGRAFWFIQFLLRDTGTGQFHGNAIVVMDVVKSPLALAEGDVGDEDVCILENSVVMRFLFDGKGSFFERFLCGQKTGGEQE